MKDRLKKQAIEDGKTVQDKLVTFGLERQYIGYLSPNIQRDLPYQEEKSNAKR